MSEVVKLAAEVYDQFIALCTMMTVEERQVIADHVDKADARLGQIHDAPKSRA